MKTRYLAMLTALVMLAAGTACAAEDSSSEAVSSAAGAQSPAVTSVRNEEASAPADTSVKEEPPADELPEMEQAYKVLSCLDAEGTPADICTCGNIAVIQCASADADDRVTVRYYVVDAVKDELLRTIDNCSSEEMLLGIDAEGTVTSQELSDDRQRLIFYKPDGSRSFSEPVSFSSYFVSDTAGQLYDLDSGISRIGSDGSRQVIFDSEEMKSAALYDSARGRAVAEYYSDSFSYSSKLMLIDTEAGREISELEAPDAAVYSAGDYAAVVCIPDYGSDEQILSVFEKETGRLSGTYTIRDSDTNFVFSDSSSYGITYVRGDGSEPFALRFIRVSDGADGRIALDLPGAEWAFSTGITSADRFLSAAAVKDSASGKLKTRLVMTDPAQVNLDSHLAKAAPYSPPEEKPHSCGEGYKELRAEADGIEEKYGIKILLGDEVLDIEDILMYGIVSDESDKASKFAYDFTRDALKTMDDMFSRYPEDFFGRFKHNGKGGLCIALCDSLTSSGGGFSAGGVTQSFGAWEIIALSSAEIEGQTGSALHHEIFHAVEDIVSIRFGTLNGEEWEALNPDDQSYTGDYDGYAAGDASNDRIYGYDDDPYFYSEYGRVTPQEDRATLIEGLFLNAYTDPPDVDGYIRAVSEKYPHLKAKYEYLGRWTAQFFGYIYWEQMLDIKL